jgi:hypothetical protein
MSQLFNLDAPSHCVESSIGQCDHVEGIDDTWATLGKMTEYTAA